MERLSVLSSYDSCSFLPITGMVSFDFRPPPGPRYWSNKFQDDHTYAVHDGTPCSRATRICITPVIIPTLRDDVRSPAMGPNP